jgi:hypothetical protein
MEANWTCPCGKGLECRSDGSSSYKKRGYSSKKYYGNGKDEYYKLRQRVHWGKYDKCPSLYKKGSKSKYYRADAVCMQATSGSQGASVQSSSSCNLTQCTDSSDCASDECCLEVEYYDRKTKTMASFCFPLLDEDEACDSDAAWSCPCGDSLTCMHKYGNGKKSKGKYLSKYYRPKVILKEGEECPNLYKGKKRKIDKYTPTCQVYSIYINR